MMFILALVVCFLLTYWIAQELIPVGVEIYKITKIIILFAIVCYQSAKPKGIGAHCRFLVATISSIPRLMEIRRKAASGEYHEQKL